MKVISCTTQLRPSQAEEKIIGNLQMRMMLEFTDEAFDVEDDQDNLGKPHSQAFNEAWHVISLIPRLSMKLGT